MGKVKDMLMDVEDFVYSFYDETGELTETYPTIITKAKEEFGICFGEYAKEVLDGDKDMEPHWDWNKSVSENLIGYEIDDKIPF